MTINPLRSRPPVEIPDRPKPTKTQKARAWSRMNGICWWCGKPVAADGPDVEWDHDIPRELSADDSTENLAPLHVRCHDQKTYGEDIPRITKAHHQEKLTRPKQRKAGGFKGWRKMNGDVVWRDDRSAAKSRRAVAIHDETDCDNLTENAS